MNTPGYQEALRRIATIGPNGKLNLSDLGLMVCPPLPPTVKVLICDRNQLISLPELPAGLEELRCSHNQLTRLPELPVSLEDLECSSNQLTRLPELPASLQVITCMNNPLEEPFATYYTLYHRTDNIDQLRESIRAYYAPIRAKGRRLAALQGVVKAPELLPKNRTDPSNRQRVRTSSHVLSSPQLKSRIGEFLSGKTLPTNQTNTYTTMSLTNQMAALKRNAGRGGSRRKTRKTREVRKSRRSTRKH